MHHSSAKSLSLWGQAETIMPILLYGSEIWGFGKCDIIERVHLKFLKYVFNLKKSTTSHMIYGELGIFLITIDLVISFWRKLIYMRAVRDVRGIWA